MPLKGFVIKLELFVLLVLLIILGVKIFQSTSMANAWGDEIFERTEAWDYLLSETSSIKESNIVQKYEGVVISKGFAFKDNIQHYTFELESALNPDKTFRLEIPSNISLAKDSLGIYDRTSNAREVFDINKFSEFIDSIDEGDFISVETLHSMDYELNMLEVETFTLLDLK
jgi:hypothetical protein